MQIDPRHLVQLATIIEEGSFTTAAEKLGTTQPALSFMLRNLEKRVGQPLLSQRRRPVTPTQLGQLLAIKGQGIRSLLEEADRETRKSRAGETGIIRVGAPSFFCEYVLAEMVSVFRRNWPNASFDIHTGYNIELHRMVAQRGVDLAFGPVVLEQSTALTRTEFIVNFSHAIVCRSGHPLLSKKRLTISDLEAADWLSHSSESELFQVMQVELSRLGISSMGNALKSSSASALMQLLQRTDCLSILPVFSALPSLREGKLALLDFRHELPEIPFGLITQNHFSPTPLEARFICHVTEGLYQINQEVAAFGA